MTRIDFRSKDKAVKALILLALRESPPRLRQHGWIVETDAELDAEMKAEIVKLGGWFFD